MCELCTVRAVLGRELGHPGDLWLLRLERMRLLDIAHSWTTGTFGQYQSSLVGLRRFEKLHPGLTLLPPRELAHPPHGAEIGVMWAELDESVRPLTGRRSRVGATTPCFNTVRQMRSAAGQFWSWGAVLGEAGDEAYFDKNRLHRGPIRPTDGAVFELFSKGMAARMGTSTVPSTALLGRHVHGLDRYFDAHYRGAGSAAEAADYATAGLVNCLAWTTWLRGGELFSITWADIELIPPDQAAVHDLPEGMGALTLRLLPETKSNRTAVADVVSALRTSSGLNIGRWLDRMVRARGPPLSPHEPLFCSRTGDTVRPWDSYAYRTRFLYPGLEFLRAAGDAFLQTLSLTPGQGNSIPEKFFAIHSYRRGARSHVQRRHAHPGHRRATKDQIYGQGRWRKPRSSEPIDVQYLHWTLWQRLQISLRSL